ncbi:MULTISPECIES: DUF4915 domain-containing protein [Pseudomonas]|jgi:hypothetical protein|uniref:DUF4915 domain-containing protein n=1 Tax=Pseudomonas TaxID=286 RepID=UPI0006996F3A|nr:MULTISPECIES: DUF4915 domain-containing protein [Pseudomonas]SFV04653.1 protein of unknown function [Pseudomonas sp. OV546]VVN66836.1 hypothetical protein PS720_00170 [Pseudomonas fluorescens]
MPDALFENLLVSSPNGGGLLFIHHRQVFRLDDLNTTGISLKDGRFLRGFQPEGLVYYKGSQTSEKTGESIHDIHDVLIVDSSCYAVGTSANEILQLDEHSAIVNRWTFPGETDAQHINCLALWGRRIIFSAFGDFCLHREYKGRTARSGFVRDLHTGERLIDGLSQPHSLVPFGDNLLLANSELMELREYDSSATLLRSKRLDGYTRGICIQGNVLYIGLSRSRNIECSSLGNANLVALDLQSWEELGRMALPIAEIYSVLATDDIKALPSILAGVSQRAALDYRQMINKRDEQIQELKNQNGRLNLIIDPQPELSVLLQLSDTIQQKEQELRAAQVLVADITQQLGRFRVALAERDTQLEVNERATRSLLDSRSWRWTLPLRALGQWFRC